MITKEHLSILQDLKAMVESEINSVMMSEAQQKLITDLAQAERAALIDPLTRLWNREGGDQLSNREWEYAKRSGTALTIALVDVDNFKAINDTYGHGVGDKAIKHVGELLLSALRPHDIYSFPIVYGRDMMAECCMILDCVVRFWNALKKGWASVRLPVFLEFPQTRFMNGLSAAMI
jgi:predicted signal transduction protein with EAL and GGDEF domain